MTILFDLDGTLTDPKRGIVGCITYALENMGLEVPATSEFNSFIGPPIEESFLRLFNNDNGKTNQAVQLFRSRYAEVGLFENIIYRGVVDALSCVRKKDRRLFVATSKPQPFAERIINKFNLSPFFEKVYGAQLDGARAKKEDIIAHAINVENLEPEQTIMVGDTKYDAIGARMHHVPCIGVLWGYGLRSELADAGVKVFCERPQDLPNVIENFIAGRAE